MNQRLIRQTPSARAWFAPAEGVFTVIASADGQTFCCLGLPAGLIQFIWSLEDGGILQNGFALQLRMLGIAFGTQISV